ncbi:MAG: hypothetical protein D6812_15335, partial [Deltaproteobacteria bacterium]
GDMAWPRFGRSCVPYSRKCTFYDVCRSGRMFKEMFTEREPDYVDEAQETAPDGVTVLNVSRLNTFRACPELYRLMYVKNLARSVDEETDPKQLVFGTAIHEALRAWYSGKPNKAGTWKPKLDDDAAIEAARTVFREHPNHDDNADEVHTSGYAELMLKRYFERYRKTDRELTITGVEVPLTAEVHAEPPFFRKG